MYISHDAEGALVLTIPFWKDAFLKVAAAIAVLVLEHILFSETSSKYTFHVK